MQKAQKIYRKYIPFAVGLVFLLIVFFYLVTKEQYCGWDFRNNVWGPANMLVHGNSPYTFSTPYGPYPSVWMPQIIGIFFWFGFFPCSVSASLWLMVELVGFVIFMGLMNERKLPHPWIFFIYLLMFLLFPPLRVHILIGQFSMLFVVLMIGIAFIPGTQRWLPLLMAVGLAKPQLGVLIYPGLILHTWRHRGFRQAAWLMLAVAICVVVMTVPLFIFYPGWMNDFLSITLKNLDLHWNMPTLYVQLPVLIGQPGYIIWGITFLVTMALSLWLWYSRDMKTAMVYSLALTPLVTLYAFSWDFLLLIPAFYWLLIQLKSKTAIGFLVIGMLVVYWFQYSALLHKDIYDSVQWWVPPAVISVFCLSLLVNYAARVFTQKRSMERNPGSL
jgi:hypothetical protein